MKPKIKKVVKKSPIPKCGHKSKGYSKSDFDPRMVRIGTMVESEHTCDLRVARKIALDHLVEDEFYYDKLKRMEKMLIHKYNRIRRKTR